MNQHADGKRSLRTRLNAVRRALPPEEVTARGARIQARLLTLPEFAAARTVALYAALPGEVPTDAVLAAALAADKTVCFPVVPAEGKQLTFRSVRGPGDLHPAGRRSIREPGASCPLVALQDIDLVVVPGLGFTREGHRLGQGGGYYDATLAGSASAGRRIGLAFSAQVLDALPYSPTDVPVDGVVTEDATFRRPGREQL